MTAGAFSIAAGGNFPELAARIKPPPWRPGRRQIDLSAPGSGRPGLTVGDPVGLQLLDCALASPSVSPAGNPAPEAAAHPAWPLAHREALRGRVDAANEADSDLPHVGARLYARSLRGRPI